MTVWLTLTHEDNVFHSFVKSIDINEYKVRLENKFNKVFMYRKDEVIKLECK